MKFNFKQINNQAKRLVALVMMGTIALTSAISVAALSQKVYIIDRDKAFGIVTINKDTNKILEQAGIKLKPNDVVERQDQEDEIISIKIKRAFKVYVKADGISKTIVVNEGTVKDAVEYSGFTVSEQDLITPDAETELTPEMEINIIRRCCIKLTDGANEVTDVMVPRGTVKNAIESLGITLNADDNINVNMDEEVYENMSLRVDRIEFKETTKREVIPFGVITKLSYELYEGEVKYQEGQDGEREVVVWEKIVNNVPVESQELNSTTLKEAVSGRKLIGIKPRSSRPSSGGYSKDNKDGTLVDHNGNTIPYTSVFTGSATAYTASPGAHTSTGALAQYGHVAVNPNVIPYGTRLYIASPDGSYVYGYAVASDTGGALMSGSALVDVYYNTLNECYQFGRRTMSVYIIG